MELADELESCIEKFWSDNPDLKRNILKDWYAGGYVGTTSNLAGLKAVGEWLNAPTLSKHNEFNPEREYPGSYGSVSNGTREGAT